MVITKPTSIVRICYVLTCFRLFSQLRKRFPFSFSDPSSYIFTYSYVFIFVFESLLVRGQTIKTLFPSTLFRFSNKINEEKSIQRYETRSKLYNVYSVITMFFFQFSSFLFILFLFILSIYLSIYLSLNLSLSLFIFSFLFASVLSCPLSTRRPILEQHGFQALFRYESRKFARGWAALTSRFHHLKQGRSFSNVVTIHHA